MQDRDQIQYFACGYPAVNYHLLKRKFLFPSYCVGTFVRNQLTTKIFSFWILNLIPLLYIFVLVAVPYILDYGNCAVILKKKKWTLKLILVLDCCGYSGPFTFLNEFKCQLFSLSEKGAGILMGTMLTLEVNMRRTAI